jgi:hypothetical protein
MSAGNYYIFTPCCGGHPVVLSQNFVIFDELPKVYKYVGVLPYVDSTGLYSLMPGQCYKVEQFVGQLAFVAGLNPTPPIENFEETAYDTCEDGALGDVKCDCPNVYQLTSCCTGETTLYNITDLAEGVIIEGSTYAVLFDPLDFTTLGCYTFNSLTIEDPESVPTLSANNIVVTPVECSDLLCQLVCNPCECVEFSGQAGAHNILTCDFKFGLVTGTPEGIVVLIEDEDPVPLTEGICLRFWEPIIFGPDTPVLTVTVKGDCDIVYWNQSGSEINCPVNYKIVNCEEPFTEICVTNDLSTYFANNQVITINGQPDLCWRVELADECVSPVTIIVTQSHLDCEDCLDKIDSNFQLTNCNDESQILYTSSNLTGFGPFISVEEYPDDCWLVSVVPGNTPSNIEVTPIDSFNTCIECSQQYYILEDCDLEDPELPIITGTDLSVYVGQIITLGSCPDICWQVSETDNTIGAQPVLLDGIETFDTCELCAEPTPPPALPVYKYKSVRPGYNTPGCSSEKYEQYMCNFSEAMYRQVMVDAYGIEPCCGDDDIRWQIKKELIVLKAITDPDYNCVSLDGCGCTTSTIGLTPCVPQCNIYNIVVLSFDGTSFRYINCNGIESIVIVEQSKESVEYVICGRAGQTINTPDNVQEFSYVETAETCTE